MHGTVNIKLCEIFMDSYLITAIDCYFFLNYDFRVDKIYIVFYNNNFTIFIFCNAFKVKKNHYLKYYLTLIYLL